MSDVKRWEPENTIVGFNMRPDAEGSFVLHDAYAKLEDEAQALREEVARGNRITVAMALDIAAVGEALGISSEDQEGGTGEFIEAIQELQEELEALRARVVILPEIAAWAWIAKLDGEDWDAGVTLGAEQPNLQAPVEGVTYDYAPLIGLKPLARLNGKAVSEGLLLRIEQECRINHDWNCQNVPAGTKAATTRARKMLEIADELRVILDAATA